MNWIDSAYPAVVRRESVQTQYAALVYIMWASKSELSWYTQRLCGFCGGARREMRAQSLRPSYVEMMSGGSPWRVPSTGHGLYGMFISSTGHDVYGVFISSTGHDVCGVFISSTGHDVYGVFISSTRLTLDRILDAKQNIKCRYDVCYDKCDQQLLISQSQVLSHQFLCSSLCVLSSQRVCDDSTWCSPINATHRSQGASATARRQLVDPRVSNTELTSVSCIGSGIGEALTYTLSIPCQYLGTRPCMPQYDFEHDYGMSSCPQWWV